MVTRYISYKKCEMSEATDRPKKSMFGLWNKKTDRPNEQTRFIKFI